MKRILIIGILVLYAVAASLAQPPQPPQPTQGLFNKLIEIKYSSELYLSNALKKRDTKTAACDSAQAIYNSLRYKIDGLVYSLSGDMITNNSPRKMRLLNEWCLNNKLPKKCIQVYATQLNDIELIYQNHIFKPEYGNTKTLNLTTNVFYLLKDSYTIIQGLADMKTKQTMALVELLDHTRLLSPGEIGKGVK
jgi:hypothetical protein